MSDIYSFISAFPVSLYGLLLFLYIGSQIYYAVKEKISQRDLLNFDLKSYPFVSIILPFYNEKFEEIYGTIDSLLKLDYPKKRYEIIVMDDGSSSTEVHDLLIAKFSKEGMIKIFRQNNMGKRDAQARATDYSDLETEYYLTVDSDTIFDPDCLLELVKVAIYYNVEAVSGGIMVKKESGILNSLLRVRYWAANWQERLSLSWFNKVNCCCGPCSLWSAKLYKKVRHEYVNQYFLGKKCTYGDDRHLTNLFLHNGAKVKMANYSVCHTSVPGSWSQWIKQQVRWSKSFYRETIWAFCMLDNKMGTYLFYQNIMALLLPFVLVFNVFYYLFVGDISMSAISLYIVSISVSGLIRGTYAYLSTFDATYFLAPIYGFVHFSIVFPIRIYSLFKLRDTKWGTR